MGNTAFKYWALIGEQRLKMMEQPLEFIASIINQSASPVGIGIDGSSTNTGVSIMSKEGKLICTAAIKRDKSKNSKETDSVAYKLRLKSELKDLLLACKTKITHIWYEEPFAGWVNATEVLMAIRTTVKEILLENKEELSSINYVEVNNKRWKSIFFKQHNVAFPTGGSVKEKAAIASILNTVLVYDTVEDKRCAVTQDEMDATGIVYAGWYSVKNNIDLKSKPPVHKFKYEIAFEIYDGTPDEAEQDILQSILPVSIEHNIPSKVLDNGVDIQKLNGRKLFDNIVYETMGDDDKLLVLIYRADKYANVLMEHSNSQDILDNIDSFGADQVIAAYVWRKNRK